MSAVSGMPAENPDFETTDQEFMEMLGPDCRSIGAFTMDAMGIEKFFVNGVTALVVTAAAVAGGIKIAREILGR